MNDVNLNIPAQAVIALENGSKIEAIKCVREQQGLGLKEAKDLVEQYIESSPQVKSRMLAANTNNAKKSLRGVIVIVLLGFAVDKILTETG